MKKSHLFTISAACSLLVGNTGFALNAIDQNQPTDGDLIDVIEYGNAQSFKQTHNTLSGAGFLTFNDRSASDTVSISVWDALPTAPGANQIASGSTVATAGSWVDIFWSPVAVTPGSTYYLAFDSANGTLGLAGALSDIYGNGQGYVGTMVADNPFTPGTEVVGGGFDFAFRTYYNAPNVDQHPTNGVPDVASTSSLLGVSMLVLGALRKKIQS